MVVGTGGRHLRTPTYERGALDTTRMKFVRYLPQGRQAAITEFAITDVASSAGTPTCLEVIDHCQLLHDSGQSEVAAVQLDNADVLDYTVGNGLYIRVCGTIPSGAAGLDDAGDELMIGFSSGKNATANSVTRMVWGKIYLSDGVLKVFLEGDDGTTDTDDQDTLLTVTAGTKFVLEIFIPKIAANESTYYGYIAVDGKAGGRVAVGAFTDATTMQPVIRLDRANNAEATRFDITEIYVSEDTALSA